MGLGLMRVEGLEAVIAARDAVRGAAGGHVARGRWGVVLALIGVSGVAPILVL